MTFSGLTILNLNISVRLWLPPRVFTLLLGILDCTNVEERLLRQVIDLTIQNGIETLDSLFDGYHHARNAVNCSATVNGWERKRCTRRARLTTNLSSSDNSSIPRMAMMSCNS